MNKIDSFVLCMVLPASVEYRLAAAGVFRMGVVSLIQVKSHIRGIALISSIVLF